LPVQWSTLRIETGSFEDFAKIPFGSERFGKEKWTGIGEFPKDV